MPYHNAANDTSSTPAKGNLSAADLHALILQYLDDDHAQETVSIALEGKSSIADYMVIASGRSSRQVASMAQNLAERVRQWTGSISRIEGLPTADWVLVDAGDVIIHLFRPEVRSFYKLERMWGFVDKSATGGGDDT